MKDDTQFSIYKIDTNKFLSIRDIEKLSVSQQTQEVLKIMLSEIKQNIRQRENSQVENISIEGFVGIAYKTVNRPNWEGMITKLFQKMEGKTLFDLENVNVSYILFYSIKESIYAMTAGYGSHLIKNYIEKSWGLYLMPKILGDNEGVIRVIKENNLYGNTLSMNKANRYTTNLEFEKKMSAVLNELSLEVGDRVAKDLGLSNGEKKRKIGMLLKDSLCLRKSIDIEQLKNVLNEIYKIEKRKDQYSMGYFQSAKKAGFSNGELFSALQDCILNGDLEKFVLIGDDYQKYCIDAAEYIIIDENGTDCYTSDERITFEELIDFAAGNKSLTKTRIFTVLKNWKVQTNDANGNVVLYPIPIINALQGFVELGEKNIPCFLAQGDWFCLNARYIDILNEEFENRMNEKKELSEDIRSRFNLTAEDITEDKYNDSFFLCDKIIVAHKSLIDGLEISDLMFWDDQNLYLMCNKMKFNACGSRDLTNQIWTSAKYLQTRLNSRDRNEFLVDYYSKIRGRYEKEGRDLKISQEEFVALFNLRIVFIAGYISGYSLKCRSNYAKFLDVDTYKKMSDMGYEYLTMNIGKTK